MEPEITIKEGLPTHIKDCENIKEVHKWLIENGNKSKALDLANTQFKREHKNDTLLPEFAELEFSSKIFWQACLFEAPRIKFKKINFAKDVSFADSTWKSTGDACFDEVIFEQPVSFSNSKWNIQGSIIFNKVTFNDTIDFSGAELCANTIEFQNCTFTKDFNVSAFKKLEGNSLSFNQCTFIGGLSYSVTDCHLPNIILYESIFHSALNLMYLKGPNTRLWCRRCKFKPEVDEALNRFQLSYANVESILLEGCTFKNTSMMLSNIRTSENFTLNSIKCSGSTEVDFSSSTHSGAFNITNCKFEKLPDFSSVYLSRPPTIWALDIHLNRQPVSLYDMIRNYSTGYGLKKNIGSGQVKWTFSFGNLVRAILLIILYVGATLCRKKLHVVMNHQDYRHLQAMTRLMSDSKNREELLKIYALENQAGRWVYNQFGTSFLDCIYSAISNYGRSLTRPLITYCCVVGSFAALFTLFSTIFSEGKFSLGNINSILSFSVANSLPLLPNLNAIRTKGIDTFFAGDPNVVVTTLMVFEGFLGLLLVFLVGLALRNIFKVN